jgi:hypothetical protein
MPFPNIVPQNITLESVTPTIVLKTINGREQRTQVAGQYFTFTSTFGNLSEEEGKALLGFIGEVRGNLTTFTMVFDGSNLGNSSGVYSGSISATGSANASTVTATSSATSGNNVFKAGDLIKFANHNKVYMVTATVNATTGGALSIPISPPLRTAVSSTAVTHKSVPITVRLAEDVNGFTMDPSLFSSYDMKFIEVL